MRTQNPRAQLVRTVLAAAALSASACGDGSTSPDAAMAADARRDPDAAEALDTGTADTGISLDAALEPDAWTMPVVDAGLDAALEPDAGPPDAGGCGMGLHDCGGTCVPEREACGVALPDACTTSADCGAAGECVSMRCVCGAGYRSCTAGCCTVAYDTVELAGVSGLGVLLDHAADGTAYVLVHEQISSSGCALRLYARPPGDALARTTLQLPTHCSPNNDHFDFAVRRDGEVVVAHAPSYAEGSDVTLYRWRSGDVSPTATMLGTGYGYAGGVGLALDDEETAWVSWARARSGGMSAAAVTTAGDLRTYMPSGASGSVEQSDVARDPMRDAVDAFWGHRYTGSFISGVVLLDGATPRDPRCAADDAAYDSMGRLFAIHDTYSSIRTEHCLAGETVGAMEYVVVRGADPPRTLLGKALAIDGEDVAFVSYYEPSAYRGSWLATTDGARWSRGDFSGFFRVPMGGTMPGRAYTAADAAPSGRMAFVVVPTDATMGDLALATITE